MWSGTRGSSRATFRCGFETEGGGVGGGEIEEEGEEEEEEEEEELCRFSTVRNNGRRTNNDEQDKGEWASKGSRVLLTNLLCIKVPTEAGSEYMIMVKFSSAMLCFY